MASKKELALFYAELFGGGVTLRPMMGEYLIYKYGKYFAGVFDDRLLVKDIPAARRLLPDAKKELPYDGAKPMLLVETEDREFLSALAEAMAKALPAPKPGKKRESAAKTGK